MMLPALLVLLASAAAAGGSNITFIGVAQPERARVNWVLKCQGCHRPDGSGSPHTAPALAGQVARFVGLPGGREYLGRVPGVADAALDNKELAELLNWTLQRFDRGHLPPNFRPYDAAELAALRRAPLRTDASQMRRTILQAPHAIR
ncbi:MAG: cytochrome C [Proteobacteria bacterium]|nr:cytochrome C [Pseudomonadota bacterium]